MCYNVYGDIMLETIINILDESDAIREYIDDRVQTLYDDGGELYYDDDLVAYLRSDKNIAALPIEDFNILVSIIIAAVNNKLEFRRYVEADAEDKSNDYEYYGYDDRASAFWHLREKQLGSYNKTLSDCYREYLEERRVK